MARFEVAQAPAPAAAPADDGLVTGRARRSTAGNRMRELLEQEIEKDEVFEEVENDVDFQEQKDEEDVVDSDFDRSSADGEGSDEGDESAGERELQAQAKASRKASRTKAVPAFMRPIVKRGPAPKSALTVHDDDDEASRNEAEGSGSAQRAEAAAAARSAKRISFAPTPRTSGEDATSGSTRKRSSSRRSTVQSAADVAERLRADEERRAAQAPRAAPPKRPRLTQDRLIAEALETEEANRESLRIFLDREEERKARDRKSKPTGIEGPFVRWHSITTGGDEGERTSLVKLIEDEQAGITPSTGIASALQDPVHADRLAARAGASTSAAPTPTLQSPQLGSEASAQASSSTALKTPTLPAPSGSSSNGTPQTSPPLSRVKQSRTLLSLRGLPPDTTWVDEFSLLLGSHCAWDAVPIVAARNRPLRPRQSTCALTGLPAVYRDPRSGVPFASAEAYALLTELLEHRFLWTGTAPTPNPAPGTAAVEAYRMGCYAAHVDDEGACGVLAAARAELAPPPVPEPAPVPVADVELPAAAAPVLIGKGKKAIAPGDEEAIVAAAQALPSGTTRSGSRRSTGGPAAAGTPARK